MHYIKEFDRGIVGYKEIYGGTWHGLDQYRVVEGGVPLEEAYQVVDYPVEKKPVLMMDKDFSIQEVPGRYTLARTDTPRDIPLHTSVSDQFVAMPNRDLLKVVDEALISKNPDITVDSVGTLANGQHCFVSLNLGRSNVSKDPSDIVGKLMYINKFGTGSIPALAHTERVVCWNTMNNAVASAKAAGEIQKFRHTANLPDRIKEYMVEMAEVKYRMEERRLRMEELCDISLTADEARDVAEMLLPMQEEATERSKKMVKNKRDKLMSRWDGMEDLQGQIRHSAYSMVQAVVAYADHDVRMAGSDEAYAYMDGLQGARDLFKQEGLNAVEKAVS